MKSLAIVIACVITAASADLVLKRDQVKTVTKTYYASPSVSTKLTNTLGPSPVVMTFYESVNPTATSTYVTTQAESTAGKKSSD